MANDTIEKVELVPLKTVKINRHRQLPEGRYRTYHITGRFYVLRETTRGDHYLIDWMESPGMLEWFEIDSRGELGKSSLVTARRHE